jgi:hypothetical protein
VRGREKAVVAALLAATGIVTGSLVGFAAGVLWLAAPLPDAGPPFVTVVALAAVLADLAYLRLGRPRPWAVGKQVPIEWSSVFSPATVAVLYGGRLGVGPLTILPTWLWWAALLAGAAAGPWVSTLTGAAFAAVRAATMLGVAEHARHSMAQRMAVLRSWEPATRALTLAGAVVLAGAVWLG